MGYYTDKAIGGRIIGGRAVAMLAMFLLLWFVIGPLIEKCSEMPGTPQLQAGQRIMYQMAGRANLRQVGFFEDHPRAKPSDFVAMISDPDHPLWPPPPPSERPVAGMGGGGDNRILMPEGLAFTAHRPSHQDIDELVYLPDDENLKLILRGYVAGADEPAFEYVWDFPTDAGEVKLSP